jgi:hypothetical protein
MKKEQRKMNLATYRKCDEIRQEVLTARNGKKVRKQDYPAAVVSCADSWANFQNAIAETSGKVDSNSYAQTPKLESALRTLGAIGGKRDENICKNYIGGCAEPHAARTVMKENNTATVNGLVFSYAYRPMTKMVIRYCRNCTDVFNVQNP